MIMDLCLCQDVKDFAFVEGLQILSLAHSAVAACRVPSDLLIISLFQSSPPFSIENIDHLFRKRRRGRWDDPPGEAVYAKHWKNHSLTARHRAPSEPYFRWNLKRVKPDFRVLLLELLHDAKSMVVECASEINSDLS